MTEENEGDDMAEQLPLLTYLRNRAMHLLLNHYRVHSQKEGIHIDLFLDITAPFHMFTCTAKSDVVATQGYVLELDLIETFITREALLEGNPCNPA